MSFVVPGEQEQNPSGKTGWRKIVFSSHLFVDPKASSLRIQMATKKICSLIVSFFMDNLQFNNDNIVFTQIRHYRYY